MSKRPPPPKGETLRTFHDSLQKVSEWSTGTATRCNINNGSSGGPQSNVVGYSGKFPNPVVAEPRPKGWLPCKDYRRHSATYVPYGVVYYERFRGGSRNCHEWQLDTYPIGVRVDSAYNRTDLNLPFTNTGQHPWMGANQENRLITECLVKVQNRKVNYGEALAESRQTVNHLAKTVTRLAKLFIGLRRGNGRLISEALSGDKRRGGNFFSRHWLEYQYAWLPLMSDAYDTYGLITKGLKARPQMIRAVRKLTDDNEVENIAQDAASTYQLTSKGRVKVEDRCILYYQVNDEDLTRYGQLGLINPLEVAWAVVPYSFVVDWFLPIGNLFQAMSATIGMTFIDGCLSRTANGSRVIECTKATSGRGPLFIKEKTTWGCASSSSSFQRVNIPLAPLPRIYMKNPFSTTHVTSAAALLTQLRR